MSSISRAICTGSPAPARRELAEARGVDVEQLDLERDLEVVRPALGVEARGEMRERSRGIEGTADAKHIGIGRPLELGHDVSFVRSTAATQAPGAGAPAAFQPL